MDNLIYIEKLVRTFRSGNTEIKALKGVSFSVKHGEFVSVTGRSGSGKSTLLYQLGLLDQPTSGKVCLDGVDTAKYSNTERTEIRLVDLGYVFQDYALVPELTALENVIIPLLMKGESAVDARRRAAAVLEEFGLGTRFGNLPNQLSGGEQQRVSIARAIAHKPKIIFADEPTANLDNETAIAILKIFKALNEQGQTIIMVTHEQEYVRFTDRTITLFDGEIVSDVCY